MNLFSIYKISFVSSGKKEQRSFTSCQLWNIPFYCHCQQIHDWCDRWKDTGILCSFAGTTINIKTSCKVMNHVHRCRNKQQKKVSDLKLKWKDDKWILYIRLWESLAFYYTHPQNTLHSISTRYLNLFDTFILITRKIYLINIIYVQKIGMNGMVCI